MSTCMQNPQPADEDELCTRHDSDLLARLAGFSTFGITHVQRIAKVGYQRAVEMIEALEADGSIIYIPQSKRWRNAMSKTELKTAYEQHKAQLKRLPELAFNDVQPFILMDIPDSWASALKRVLVVGQETMGWDFEPGDYYEWPYPPIKRLETYLGYDASVDAMMHGYRVFEFSAHQSQNYNSGFWRAYRQVRAAVGNSPDGFETTVLYTNLFKNAVDGGSIVKNGSEADADAVWQYSVGLLAKEIEILKPDVVIMFTGPDYDRYLGFEFAGVEFNEVDGHSTRVLSRLSHQALPEQTYRTYHPNYLSRGHWHLVDELCERVRQA